MNTSIQVLKVLQAPPIFGKPFLVMAPNRHNKGVVAPYLFDTRQEAEEFLENYEETNRRNYWWEEEPAML